jgi:D-alanyl-D-alanine endopeptidase (penicillin-binding protein 7)
MPTLRRARLGRFAQVLSLLALSCALTAPGAHAAPAKKAAKKQVAVAPVKKKAVKERATAAPQGKRVAKSARQPSRVAARSAASPIRAVAYEPRQSFGQMAGLHAVADPLDLKSSVALVLDQDTHEVLLSKNDHAVLPIASLTKLMTGLLISQAHLPMDETIPSRRTTWIPKRAAARAWPWAPRSRAVKCCTWP